ncbi:MAG TPA: glycosyltransferase family 39 protein [Phycisphaerae bacterium]|nr:glycosyltransferase family 39 protein [Phycisphaerae bacterium]
MAVSWRLIAFFLRMPMWGDEAMLDLNIMNRSLSQMLRPLDYGQVAPPLFLIGEWLMQHIFGSSEFAVRLLPLAAGLAAVVIFWQWSRMLLGSLGTLIAVGFFALGYYLVRHSVEMKPYSMDQFASLCLYFLGTAWLIKPKPFYLLAAAVLMPILFGLSYPVVFVAGGLCLAVVVELLKNRSIANWFAWFIYTVATLISFLAVLKIAGEGQYQQTAPAMLAYWQDSFPPHNPFRFVIWLINIHTGNMFAYPVGGRNGGSTATFLLFLVGLAVFYQRKRKFLVLLLAPFALTFIAAVMQRYPYGGSDRVAQHLAPVICLLAGAGVASLVEWFVQRKDWISATPYVAGILFMIVGIIGITKDIIHPYKTPADQKARQIVENVLSLQRGGSGVAVLQRQSAVPVNFQLYLRWSGNGIIWNALADQTWTYMPTPHWVELNFDSNLSGNALLPQSNNAQDIWQVTGQDTWYVQIGPQQYGPTFCQAVYLTKGLAASNSAATTTNEPSLQPQ